MSSDVKIRKSRPGDRDPIIRMCKASLRETYGPFLDADRMKPWVEGAEADRYVDTMLANMWVAEDDERVVGVTALKDYVIDLLWVAEDLRRTGIGTLLMDAVEDALFTAGYPKGALECFSPNTNAIDFYEDRGWKVVDQYPDSVARVDKVLMQKQLDGLSAGELDN